MNQLIQAELQTLWFALKRFPRLLLVLVILAISLGVSFFVVKLVVMALEIPLSSDIALVGTITLTALLALAISNRLLPKKKPTRDWKPTDSENDPT